MNDINILGFTHLNKNNHKEKIAVLYLARIKEGLSTFEEFTKSYLQHEAGQEHELIIIYKGAFKKEEKAAAEALFKNIPHRSFAVSDDIGYDIHAYLTIAEQIDHAYVCMLNTYTTLASPQWLKKLYSHFSKPGVGMVGASGSYASLLDANKLLRYIAWLFSNNPFNTSSEIEKHFSWILKDLSSRTWLKKVFSSTFWNKEKIQRLFELALYPFAYLIHKPFKARFPHGKTTQALENWVESNGLTYSYVKCKIKTLLKKKTMVLDRAEKADILNDRVFFEKLWLKATQQGNIFGFLSAFPPFPNAHIRSNVFMVSRETLLEFRGLEKTKDACFRFESGVDSLTNRILKRGLSILVIGADGIAYPPEEWPMSCTFHLGKQENLMACDNQSLRYTKLSEPERHICTYIAWGEYASPSLPIIEKLDHKFNKREPLILLPEGTA